MHESNWSTATAIGSREKNEDTYGVLDTRNGPEGEHVPIAVVCDGLGGHGYGEVAAETAAEACLERFSTPPPDESVDVRLRSAADAANRAVGARRLQESRLYNMGTTLTAAAITEDGLSWIGIGDSPLLHWRARTGELYCVNVLHNRPGRPNELTSAVMGEWIPEVDWPVHAIPLRVGDALIVASDGIDTLDRDAVAEIAAADAGAPPSRLGERILEAVAAVGKPRQDNTTLACLRVGENHASRLDTAGLIEGSRTESGTKVTIAGRALDPAVSLEVENHSPSGFEWGCQGSGPSQLALAILLEMAIEEVAVRCHQEFKREFLTGIRSPEWRLRTAEVEKWLTDSGNRGEA